MSTIGDQFKPIPPSRKLTHKAPARLSGDQVSLGSQLDPDVLRLRAMASTQAKSPLSRPGHFQITGTASDAPAGRPNPGVYPSERRRIHPQHTRPTGPLGAKPGGKMEPLEPKDPDKYRAQLRQLDSANLLAARGYRIDHRQQSQLPGVKNPDFTIEGKPFDNYAPSSGDLDHLRTKLQKKVKSGQTRRVVVNLDDSPVRAAELQQRLLSRPVRDLEEVITIRRGEIEHIYP
jgi:hypothetical protein